MVSFQTLRHDLLELKGAATLLVAGDPNAQHVLFFCAGFPCDHSSFAPLAERLASDCGCLVGVSCIAEYDHDVPLRPQGYDLDEMAACFAQGVAALRAHSTRASHTLTLVVHDWGIAPGFMFSNSVGCDKLVVFDVLPSDPTSDVPDRGYYALVHLNYQSFFAISFALSRFCSMRLARLWLSAGTLLIFGVLGRWLNPISPRTDGRFSNPLGAVGFMPWQRPDAEMSGALRATPYRCYPYFHALKNIARPAAMRELTAKMSFDASLKKQPVCFIFGEEKNTHFHNQAQLAKLRATAGCEVVGVPNAGHWCYKHEPELCFGAVKKFVFGA